MATVWVNPKYAALLARMKATNDVEYVATMRALGARHTPDFVNGLAAAMDRTAADRRRDAHFHAQYEAATKASKADARRELAGLVDLPGVIEAAEDACDVIERAAVMVGATRSDVAAAVRDVSGAAGLKDTRLAYLDLAAAALAAAIALPRAATRE